jgi:hypothetical protein
MRLCKEKVVLADMESMARNNESSDQTPSEGEKLRRRGDRRTSDLQVAEDRRKAERRDTPGVTGLMATLLHHDLGLDD